MTTKLLTEVDGKTWAKKLGYFFKSENNKNDTTLKDAVEAGISKEEIVDIAIFILAYEITTLHVFDGKNKYATYLLKNERKVVDSDEYQEIIGLVYKSYASLNISLYQNYIWSDEKTREEKRANGNRLSSSHYFHLKSHLNSILTDSEMSSYLKSKYDINDFKSVLTVHVAGGNNLIENISSKAGLVKLFANDDLEADELMSLVLKETSRINSIASHNSKLLFQYLVKAIEIIQTPNVCESLNKEVSLMRSLGSQHYVPSIQKLESLSKKIPNLKKLIPELNNSSSMNEGFLEEGFDAIVFNLYVSALQKESKKHKFTAKSAEKYCNEINDNLRKLSSLEFVKNLVCVKDGFAQNGDSIITIVFEYVESSQYSKDIIKSLYAKIITQMVTSNYSLDENKANIHIQELLMTVDANSLPQASNKKAMKM